MPVTPQEARKLARERLRLLEKIDQAIIEAYQSDQKEVRTNISKEQFHSELLVEWLRKEYGDAGWIIKFEQNSNAEEMTIILEEKK